jgi:small subunit ribosomal protein S13
MKNFKFLSRSVSEEDKIGKFLTSTYGLSRTSVIRICRQLGFFYSDRFFSVPFVKLNYLENFLNKINLGLDLQRIDQNNITDKIRQGGYNGLRLSQNLPSRGQRSKTNAQTCKKKSKRVSDKSRSSSK